MKNRLRSDIGQFGMIPLWLLSQPNVGHVAIRLFCIMAAKYADRETGECYPSRKQLSEDLGVSSLDTVDRAIKELMEARAIGRAHRTTEDGDKDSNLYTLFFVPPSRTNQATGGRTDRATVAAPVVHKPESSKPESDLPKVMVVRGRTRATTTAPKKRKPPTAKATGTKGMMSLDEKLARNALHELTGRILKSVSEEVSREMTRGPNRGVWIVRACQIAAEQNVRSWAYVKGILENWDKHGFDAPMGAGNGRSGVHGANQSNGAVRAGDGRHIGTRRRVPGEGVDWDAEADLVERERIANGRAPVGATRSTAENVENDV